MLAVVLILAVLLIVVLMKRQNFMTHLDKLESEIQRSSDPSFPRTDLPPIVMTYLSRVGVSNQGISKFVTLAQEGQMWSAPGGKPMDFTAKQIISTK